MVLFQIHHRILENDALSYKEMKTQKKLDIFHKFLNDFVSFSMKRCLGREFLFGKGDTDPQLSKKAFCEHI